MANVLIIFGSTSGNTQLVAEKVASVLEDNKQKVVVKRVEQASIEDLNAPDLLIFGSSTYGHGLLQDHFIPFEMELRKHDLKGKPCAVIGLGDKLYDEQYHIESAKILEEMVQEANGKLVVEALQVEKSPIPALDNQVKEWTLNLIKSL